MERRLFVEKLETGFTLIFMFYIGVLTISIMVYVAILYGIPDLQEVFAASRKTPWGIVTSLFVHLDVSHLLNNMMALFLFLMLFLASNIFLSKDELKTRIRNMFLTILAFPVMLNFSWIFSFPDITIIGSSGIVYTLEGICFGFSLPNALEIRDFYLNSNKEKRQLLISLLFNLAVFLGFLVAFLVSPTGFLGSTYEITVWFHSVSLWGGFAVAVLHSILRSVR
jgi:membrane associated rhomboid family serine protease